MPACTTRLSNDATQKTERQKARGAPDMVVSRRRHCLPMVAFDTCVRKQAARRAESGVCHARWGHMVQARGRRALAAGTAVPILRQRARTVTALFCGEECKSVCDSGRVN